MIEKYQLQIAAIRVGPLGAKALNRQCVYPAWKLIGTGRLLDGKERRKISVTVLIIFALTH